VKPPRNSKFKKWSNAINPGSSLHNKHLIIFLPFFSFFAAFPLRKGPKRDPKRADGVAVEKRRGRGPAFFQPAGKPIYFSGLFSVSEQLNLELLGLPYRHLSSFDVIMVLVYNIKI
jgi:hypothetical protein